jgi:hypothetical protein
MAPTIPHVSGAIAGLIGIEVGLATSRPWNGCGSASATSSGRLRQSQWQAPRKIDGKAYQVHKRMRSRNTREWRLRPIKPRRLAEGQALRRRSGAKKHYEAGMCRRLAFICVMGARPSYFCHYPTRLQRPRYATPPPRFARYVCAAGRPHCIRPSSALPSGRWKEPCAPSGACDREPLAAARTTS